MVYKIIVWGFGGIYNSHVNLLRYFEEEKAIQVVALTATGLPGFCSIDGYPLVEVKNLSHIYYDYIIVMSDDHFRDIVKMAVSYGISESRILPYRILDIPFLDFEEYIRLKESNITIISNNCWGGVVYHTLGLECRSPFKNLFLEDADYIRLLQNLRYYMECDMQFGEYKVDVHSKEKYPVMMLGDVSIHCNHDKIPECAIEKWNRRKQKMNYENLFIEMYTEEEEAADEFLELKQYACKVCFTPFWKEKEGLVQLKLYPGQKEFYEVVNSNASLGGNSVDYRIIDLLKTNIVPRYEV